MSSANFKPANTAASLLEFNQVSYQYPGQDFDIIDKLSFSVEPGSFHCIIGTSGCGKSTIFRMTNGLLEPKSGSIRVGEHSSFGSSDPGSSRPGSSSPGSSLPGSCSPVKRRRPPAKTMRCGYMPQKDLLFPWRTVGENLALPLEIQGVYSKKQQREMIDAALAEVGLKGCRDKRPDELSGGMRQRAAFARTMLTGSELLLLDEPFSALDFLTRITMQEWLLDLWQRHRKTILFITHDVEEAIFLSSSVLVVESTPIQTLREIPVPLGYPRTRQDLAQPEIIELREQLVDMLRKQVLI